MIGTNSLEQALVVLGAALTAEMHNDVRDNVADALANLARRRGQQRDQQMVLKYIAEARNKPARGSCEMGRIYAFPCRAPHNEA